jgi:hypothetical protein
MSTTAVLAVVPTGTAVKTMLQIATPTDRQMQLISWGFSLDTIQSAVGVVELIQTDVAATVTAHVAAGVQPLDPNAPASKMTLGIAATGYTASVEGTTTASRTFDAVAVNSGSSGGAPHMLYAYQFMPDERPIVAVSKFVRVRVDLGTSAGMLCWTVWDE